MLISLYFYISAEKEAAHNYYLKDFAKNNYVETDANSILPENEGKLVLVHGQTSTEDFITDPVFM